MKLLQRLAVGCVVIWMAAGASPRAHADGYAGSPLTEALDRLRTEGLRLVYSTSVVPSDLRVEREPRATEPRRVLDELLQPHGLQAVEVEGGVLTIVTAPGGTLVGRVLDASDREPVRGAEVRDMQSGARTVSGSDGSFRLDELPAGERSLEVRRPGYVVTTVTVEVPSGGEGEVEILLDPAEVAMDEIVVTPSRFGLFEGASPASVHWSREDVSRLPQLSDDLFRAVSRLPGLTAGDFSADFHIRGGDRDDVLVIFDGLRVYEPFHLKDFQNVFSIFDTNAVSSVEVTTGGFPVEYGDRTSGVIEIASAVPSGPRTVLGISFEKALALSEGVLPDGAGHWLALARRGYIDVLLQVVEGDGTEGFDPTYFDLFGKVQRRVAENTFLTVSALGAYDSLAFDDDDGAERIDSRYGNAYVWAKLDGLAGRLGHSTVVSIGRVDGEREGTSAANLSDPLGGDGRDRTEVFDDRALTVAELRQSSTWDAGRRQWVKLGGEVRWQEVRYDYRFFNTVTDPSFPSGPQRRDLALTREGWAYAAYLGDRFRLGPRLTLELGLRWDRQTHVGSAQTSPRANLVTELAGGTLRASWGRFHQSQGLYELQIADGVTDYFPAHRSEQTVLGFDRPIGAFSRVGVQLYSKRLSGLRPRYENLFEPIDLFPEGQSDRILVAPEEGRARGVELLLEARRGRFDGWITYAWAEAEDRVAGRWVPRSWDQRHTVSYALNYRPGERWNFNLAGIHRSGWPTTGATLVQGVSESGQAIGLPEVVLGPRNAERFSSYHRLDLRASRQSELRRGGSLTWFLEITNLLGRDNPRAITDLDLVASPDGGLRLEREVQHWLPRIPSFGVAWTR